MAFSIEKRSGNYGKKHEFTSGIFRTDEYLGYGELNMPFTWWEYQDALEKARVSNEETPVKIELSYTKRDFLLPHTMDKNDGTFNNLYELLELNLLARQLSDMDETTQKCFEAQVELEQKSPESDETIPFPFAKLINLTYQTQNCMYGGSSHNYSNLGRFLFESDMLSDDIYEKTTELFGTLYDDIPEEWMTFVGRQRYEDYGGVFTDAGYFECPTEIPEVYKRGETDYFNHSGALVELEVRKDGEEVVTLGLPTSDEKMTEMLKSIGANSIDECEWQCVECQIPFAKESITQTEDFEQIEEFANFLQGLEQKEVGKYKALLQAAECSDLETALTLGANLNDYEFFPLHYTLEHYGLCALYEAYGEETTNALSQYMDCFKYGKDMMDKENAVDTEYGVIRRKNLEPIIALESDMEEDESQGMGGMDQQQ